jgi:thiol-disulfide isomerase/thioredoxin
MKPADETFKFYLVHFVNEYAKSKIVGMDAVYVHLVKNYYEKGLAPWTEEEQLKKMIDNANTLEPLLIGKIAPDIKMQKLDVKETLKLKDVENEHKRFKVGESLSLHEVKSPYTVLLFWASDCGHCKKSMPGLVEFNENFKNKGVTVFSVCTKTYKDVPACAELLDKNNALNWINVVDPYFRSKFGSIYDVRSTPQIYILDDKKEIISKRIGAEQLPEVMQQILDLDEKKKSDHAAESGK